MIKLINLNKFFNKNKGNEIHVINNTNLEFPQTGLVALTGPSGCGKTTLLNVIGGLDKFDSGEIHFDEHVMSKYKPFEWDIIRNKYVGYIFQNYNLVEDKTVYENIELSLNMAGLHDKEKIEERINYVLTSVGMYNYRRRNVQALSGGQQQRVAIARAIAKNPKVVLADEPTGNLDANNTFEIMSIIKKISQECLVILVSHERSLVDFYADKVIELSDGKVIGEHENVGNKSFEHKDDRIIYLKDLNRDDSLIGSGIERYYEHTKDEELSFQIIEVKDSIYIRAKSQKKIKYLTDETEIVLLNEHYKAKQSEDALAYSFDLQQFGPLQQSSQKKSYIKMDKSIKNGFKKMFGPRKVLGKLFLLVYFVISALVAYEIATLGNLTMNDESSYLSVAHDIVGVQSEDYLYPTDINYILDHVDNIDWVPYFDSIGIGFDVIDYYQGNGIAYSEAFPMKVSQIDPESLIYGNMPENNLQIVVDVWILNNVLEVKKVTDLGITDVRDFIGHKLYPSGSFGDEHVLSFEIVGIIDTDAPVIAVEDDSILAFVPSYSGYVSQTVSENRINIESGRDIEAENEMLIGENNPDFVLGSIYNLYGTDFTVVGTFSTNPEWMNNVYGYMVIIPDNQVEAIQKIQVTNEVNPIRYGLSNTAIYFYTDDMEKAIEDINNLDRGYSVSNAYEQQKANYLDVLYSENMSQIRFALIVLAGIIVYIFFIMRSSMLGRIKEIGIYRSIGATKRDIYKIFLGEIFATTTMGSLTGYLAMSLLIYRVIDLAGGYLSLFYLPVTNLILGILFIYALNLIFGMLPVFNLLRKTPSEINVKYDI